MPPSDRPRTLEQAKTWMRDRLAARRHPMNLVEPEIAGPVIEALTALDGQTWGEAWGEAGTRLRNEARAAAATDRSRAASLMLQAHGLYFLGRFPCPNHPRKLENAVLERETYLEAAEYFDIPTQRIVVPFAGRADEGREVVFLYRRPPGVERAPVVVMWGGVDAWKEQLTGTSDGLLKLGVATIAMDGPGTGESPVTGSADGERQFLPVFDWAAAQPDLDGARVGLLGRSFGGYWAAKLAHTQRERIFGAVNWGGGAHHMFQRDWVEASRFPDSYLMELVETRSRMLGAANDEEYIAAFEQLSLLDQGLLDRPCAPLLLVNGKEDRQCPIEDVHLLIEHGSPKSVRLFPGGHMGHTPRTVPTIIEWLAAQAGVLEGAVR
jgi:pimeloyl-ACP methyl ester carboxylesterase